MFKHNIYYKIRLLLLIVVLTLIMPCYEETVLAGGPEVITSVYGLRKMKMNGHYILGKDLEVYSEWAPLGTNSNPFRGTLDGNGHTIKGIRTTKSNLRNQALFGYTDGATIKNLRLVSVDIKGFSSSGGVAGTSRNTDFYNIYVSGKIRTTGAKVGFIVGELSEDSLIDMCESDGSIYYDTTYNTETHGMGGIVGKATDSTITKSSTQIYMSVSRYTDIGGIAGRTQSSTVSDCYARGDISHGNSSYVGGLIGVSYKSKTYNSYAAVKLPDNNVYVCGLVGYGSNNTTQSSYFDKEVSRTSYTVKGTPKSTWQMKNKSTYSNWDFTRVWTMSNGGYPELLRNKVNLSEIQGDKGTNHLNLSWEKVEDGATYTVLYEGREYKVNEPNFNLNDLEPGSKQELQIKTKTQSGMTSDWVDYQTYLLTDPPSALSSTQTKDKIVLTWDRAMNSEGYEIAYLDQIIDIGDTLSYTANTLLPNTSYTFQVRSYNQDREVSEWSPTYTVNTVPETTDQVTLIPSSSDIRVSWNTIPNIDWYEVEVDNTQIVRINTDTYYLHIERVPNSYHEYRIRGVNTYGTTEWSDSASIYTLLETPSSLEIAEVEESSQINHSITWDHVEGAASYEIEVDGTSFITHGNAYINPNIIPNSTHSYRVKAMNNHTSSKWSAFVQQGSKLLSPADLVCRLLDDDSLEVDFTGRIGATRYELDINGTIIDIGESSPFVYEPLSYNMHYGIRIRSKNSLGESEWSTAVFVDSPIGAPLNFRLEDRQTDTIDLQWDEMAGIETYELRIDEQVYQVTGNSYHHSGLEASSSHTYQLRPYQGERVGYWSDLLTIHTIIDHVEDIKGSDIKTDTITITWPAVTGAVGYKVMTDGVTYDVPHNQFTHENLIDNTPYTYRVKAIAEDSESQWSEAYTFTSAPAIPANVQANAIHDQITITWDDVEDIAYYELLVDGRIIQVEDTQYEHKRLIPKSKHTYAVRAHNGQVASQWSKTLYRDAKSITDTSGATVITSVMQLKNMKMDGYYILGCDLTLYSEWEPIGRNPYPFEGIFDGNGYTISGIRIDKDNERGKGLFGYTNKALIKNLKLKDIQIKGYSEIGGVAGVSRDTEFHNIEVSGQITGTGSHIGFIVGEMEGGKVDRSRTFGTYTFVSKFSGVGTYMTGGLVGYAKDAHIENSYTELVAKGSNYSELGGITGRSQDTTITNCYSRSDFSKAHYYYVGGLSGIAYRSHISKSYAAVKLSKEKHYIGGIVGYGSGNSSTGAYYDKDLSDTTYSVLGTAKSTQTMKTKSSYSQWDFEEVWDMESGNYPILRMAMVNDESIVYNIETDSIHVSWEDVPHVDHYILYHNGTQIKLTSTAYSKDHLKPGGHQAFKLRTVTDKGILSDWVSFDTYLKTIPPKDITATGTSESITLSWDTSSNATGYEIDIMGVPTSVGPVESYTVSNLSPNTPYVFRIRSINSLGELSQWSGNYMFKTLPDTTKSIELMAGSDYIDVTWEPIVDAIEYEIEMDQHQVVTTTSTSYRHDQLGANTEHQYCVRGLTSNGYTKWSSSKSGYTLMMTPTNLQIQEVQSDSSISHHLTWDTIAGATYYEIEVDGAVITSSTNQWTKEGIIPNSTHSYRVRGKNEHTESGWSGYIQKGSRLLAPTDVTMRLLNHDKLEIGFTGRIGATSYEVDINGVTTDIGEATSYTYDGVAYNQVYTIKVRAKNAIGYSDWSEITQFETTIGGPVNFRMTNRQKDSITLQWDAMADVTAYELLIDGESHMIDGNSYRHEGLEPYSNHIYRLRAYKQTEPGPWSSTLRIQTVVSGVGGLQVKDIGSDYIALSWTGVDGASHYVIQVGGETIEVQGEQFRHTSLEANTNYDYQIKACSTGSESDWSSPLTVKTAPQTPTGLRAKAVNDQIDITWTPVPGATYYELAIDGQVVKLDNTKYNHTDLIPNSRHSYSVRAGNGESESDWCDEIYKNALPLLTVKTKKDSYQNFVFVIPSSGQSTRYISVYYDYQALEVADLCAMTGQREKGIGPIENTNIEVVAVEPGYILYKVSRVNKTFMNTIQFIKRSNDYGEIRYDIE